MSLSSGMILVFPLHQRQWMKLENSEGERTDEEIWLIGWSAEETETYSRLLVVDG